MKKRVNKPIKPIQRQSGWTFWGLLFSLSVAFCIVYIGIRLVPIYTNNRSVQAAMELALREVESINSIKRSYVINKMSAQLYLDGNSGVLDYKNDLTVRRLGRKVIIRTKYNAELPLFFNLSLLAKFDNMAEKKF